MVAIRAHRGAGSARRTRRTGGCRAPPRHPSCAGQIL